ncbi:MAG: polysaccharide biosynthesis protein, partial [Bacteroidota bacterium]
DLKISTARFANVAFSNGSLLFGFIQSMMKRQPLSAPSDVKRYFVSPEESGQLCMLACMLGKSSDIFFPKLDASQMMTFSSIAEHFLASIGLKPHYCVSDEEARLKAKAWTSDNPEYPVYFFKTDTSGEKSFEEFYTATDEVDNHSFNALGVVKNSEIQSRVAIDEMLLAFQQLFETQGINKAKVIDLLNQYLPDFQHIETGKSLDQKM